MNMLELLFSLHEARVMLNDFYKLTILSILNLYISQYLTRHYVLHIYCFKVLYTQDRESMTKRILIS